MAKKDKIEEETEVVDEAMPVEEEPTPEPLLAEEEAGLVQVFDSQEKSMEMHRTRYSERTFGPMIEMDRPEIELQAGDVIHLQFKAKGVTYEGKILEAVEVDDRVCVTFDGGLNPA